jgi:hypothetical protein
MATGVKVVTVRTAAFTNVSRDEDMDHLVEQRGATWTMVLVFCDPLYHQASGKDSCTSHGAVSRGVDSADFLPSDDNHTASGTLTRRCDRQIDFVEVLPQTAHLNCRRDILCVSFMSHGRQAEQILASGNPS